MPLLLVLLVLLQAPTRSATQEKRLQDEGARELARRMQTDENFKRGRLLAQAVAHYRIAVADHIRETGREPDAADIIRNGYLLTWASAGTRGMPIQPKSQDTRTFRLLQDGPLPDFAYLSYGLEHPQGEGTWETSWKWVPTNIQRVIDTVRSDRSAFTDRRRGIEIQLAAPLELHFVFTRELPSTYAQACTVTRMVPLNTTATQPCVEGLSLWVLPQGNRYATVWDEASGEQTVTVYGYPKDSIDARKVDDKLTPEFVQVWPPAEGTPAILTVGADSLIGDFAVTLPKNEGEPGKIDITPIPLPPLPKVD
ncbi:MAG: hypothetical protein GEEBNDBF_02547 [bacterium]|nr:hypothetical protein [bacterium]